MIVCFLNVGYQSVLILIGFTILMGVAWRRILLKVIQNDLLRWIAVVFLSLLSTGIVFAMVIALVLHSVNQALWHK